MLRVRALGLRDYRSCGVVSKKADFFFAVIGLLLCLTSAAEAQVTSPCYQWGNRNVGGTNTGWFSSPDGAGARYAELCNTPGNQESCDNVYCTDASIAAGATCVFTYTHFVVNTAWPGVILKYQKHVVRSSGRVIDDTGNWLISTRTNPAGCKVYVSAPPPPRAECGSSCNGIGDPINPANASVYKTEADSNISGGLAFGRFYNSADSSGGSLGSGWRHSFSRSITTKYSGSTYKAYVSSASNSSQYSTEALACTSGFSQIKSQVSAWANASASYADGICSLSVGSTVIGTLPLYYTSPPTPAPGTPILIGLEATRDDGQVVSFKVQGSVISAPPSIAMRLQQTSSGYTLTDVNDNVEIYDVSGRLLSITSRAGVVQTMGYNAAGRLSTVTDSFGHGVTLTYDSQGRISAVTQQ